MGEGTPSRHERRKLRTRRLLLDTTEALLIDRGYDALTVQDITDRADVARGTFYVHFRDKDEALWEIVEARFADLAPPGRTDTAIADRAQNHYQTWRRIFDYAADNRVLLRVLLGEQGHIGLARRIQARLAEILERDLARDSLEPIAGVPADFTTQYLVGALVQTIHWWLRHPGRYTVEDMTRHFYMTTLRQAPPIATAGSRV